MADTTLKVRMTAARKTESEWNVTTIIPKENEVLYTKGGLHDGEYKIGDGTHRWSDLDYIKPSYTYPELEPLMTKTYNNVICTANSDPAGYLYFMTIKPNNYNTAWTIRYRVHATIAGVTGGYQDSEVLIEGTRNTYLAYSTYNAVNNTSYRPYYYHMYFAANETGQANNYPHLLGFRFQSSYNPATTANSRTIVIEILEYKNCTLTFLDTMKLFADMPGSNSTNYGNTSSGANATRYSFDGTTQGWTFVGDRNTYPYLLSAYYTRPYAGVNGTKQYSLAMEDSVGRLQSFTTTHGTGTSKAKNTQGFRLGRMYYLNSSGNYTEGQQFGNDVSRVFQSDMDLRYSTNCGTTLTAFKPVYIVGTVNPITNLFYLDDTWWTQTLPTSEDGKIYIYIGCPYDTYRLTFEGYHDPVWYKDGAIRPFYGNTLNVEQLQEMRDSVIEDSTPYLFRPSANGNNIGDREYPEIIGGTVAWNQHVTFSQATYTEKGLTIKRNADGTIEISGTATEDWYSNIGNTVTSFLNHKILIKGCPSGGSSSTYSMRDGYTAGDKYKDFGDGNIVVGKANFIIQIIVGRGTALSTPIIFKPQAFDLTAMFGTSIADQAYAMEQATAKSGIAWLKSMGFFTADYYPYDAGTLKSVEGLASHDMIGFNQWDEEWESGYYDANGQPVTNSLTIRSKNYIEVMPDTAYFFKATSGTNNRICYFDVDKNFIYRTDLRTPDTAFTTPTNCRFVMFHNDGTTYSNDICINLSDPAKNGTYEPYEKHSYPLDSTLTLRGIPKLVDGKLQHDGDRYASDGTVTRRYGVVVYDGSADETWVYESSNRHFYIGLDNVKRSNDYEKCMVSNIKVASKAYSWSADAVPMVSAYGNTSAYPGKNWIYIKPNTDSVTDVATFRTWLSANPVTVVYELATPTTETAQPFQSPQIVDDFGTEEYVIANTVDVPIPVGHNTKYELKTGITTHGEVVDAGVLNSFYTMIKNEFVSTKGDIMTGPLTLDADPTLAMQPATKKYVDQKIGTAYESKDAEQNGTEVSLVTTGEKYNWNQKTTTSFTPTLSTGTKIGTITINGTATDLYCQTNTNILTGVKGSAESTYRTGNVNLTPVNIGALALTGGTLTGSVTIGQTTDTAVRTMAVQNSLSNVALAVGGDGKHGIFSNTKGDWLLYATKDANSTNSTLYVPRPLSVSGLTSVSNNVIATASDTSERYFRAVNSNGSIELNASAGNKGVYDRSGGRWIMYLATNSAADTAVIIPRGLQVGEAGINGYIELYHATPYIDFHYGRSTADYTTRLIENASGVLTIEGRLYNSRVPGSWVAAIKTAALTVNMASTTSTSAAISGMTIRTKNGYISLDTIPTTDDNLYIHYISTANYNAGTNTVSAAKVSCNITGHADGDLPLTGGSLTGNLFVSASDTSERQVSISNSLGHVYLDVSTSGNHGLYSGTKGGWIIYCTKDASSTNSWAYIPRALNVSGHIHSSNEIHSGGKSTSQDGHAGAILSGGGHLYLQQGATGSNIYFIWGAGKTITSRIYESASGTLTASGNWDVGGKIHATGNITSTAHVSCGGKESGGDGNPGCFMNNGGSFFITGPANSGGTIFFHYNKATSNTSKIYESSSGTIKVDAYLWGKNSSGGSHIVVTTVDTDNQKVAYLSTNTTALYVNARHGGSSYANKSVTLSSSDVRLKTNIADSTINALDVINKIRIREFDWTDEREDKHQVIGMVADEIEKLDKKFAVGGGYTEDGCMNIKSVDTFYLTGYLTKGIQELNGKVDGHDDRIAALERENKELRKEIEELKKEIA